MTRREQVLSMIQVLEAQPERLSANWSLPKESARFLYLLARMTESRRALEVGTSIGYSGLYLSLALLETGGHLETIDASADRLEQARKHFEEAGVADKITIHQGDALVVLAQLQAGQYDLMFLDARKSEYLAYFQYAKTLLKPGGILLADNTQSHREDMLDFIEAVTTDPLWETADLDTSNGVLLARRIEEK